MKLKKIASLALAGVMAVSMLAGCATKTETTPNEGTTTVTANGTAAVVEAFNAAQDTVKFSSDVTLQKAVDQAAKEYTFYADSDDLEAYIPYVTGESYLSTTTFTADTKNTETVLVGAVKDSAAIWSEDAAVKQAVKSMEATIANYKTTTFEKDVTEVNDTYYDYAYTGNVAVTSYTAPNGVVYYYLAYTITRTVTEQTYTGKAA